MDAYIDGYSAQTCEVYETSNRVSYKYVILEQYFGTCVNTMIEDIYLWNVEEPWAGELPSYTLDFNREQFKEQKSEGAYDENWITGTMSERWYYGKNGVRWYDITAFWSIY